MIATGSLASRIEFPNVQHVINFDLPSDFDEYIFRVACTGKLGKLGLATSFFNDKNWNLSKKLKEFVLKSKQEYPNWLEAANLDETEPDDLDENEQEDVE